MPDPDLSGDGKIVSKPPFRKHSNVSPLSVISIHPDKVLMDFVGTLNDRYTLIFIKKYKHLTVAECPDKLPL